jgi:S1-C subfamily serine protease
MADSPSPQSALQLSRDLAALVAAAASAVVAVHARGRRPSSGLIWQLGLVISAEETVERETGLALTLPDGRRVDATLVGRDPSTDIALLRYTVDAAEDPAGLATRPASADLKPGHLVVAVGRYDDEVVAALGMISLAGAAWRSREGGRIDARVAIDTRLPAVAEGGALVAADGSLVGMAVFGPRRRVLAIPTATLGRIVAAIKDQGHISRGYLGVGLQRVPVSMGAEARRAAMVVTVDPQGPASRAGILQGDIIVAVGGTAVTGLRSLYQQLGPDTVGQKTAIELIRAGAQTKVDVTIAPRPRG